MKPRRFERALGASVVVALILVALFTQVPMGDESPAGSVTSTRPGGRRALFVALSELGLQVEAWDQAPARLPRGDHVLWLAMPPSDYEPGSARRRWNDKGEEDKPGGDKDEKAKDETAHEGQEKPEHAADEHPHLAARIGMHAFAHYRRFVEEGGTLVLAASTAARHFLVDGLGFGACGDVQTVPHSSQEARLVRMNSGDSFRIDSRDGLQFEPLDANGPARELWTERDDRTGVERPFALLVPAGAGSVVMLADDAFLNNGAIGAQDHALAAVRLAEELGRGGRILFDEYALGLWQPETALGIAFSGKLLLGSLHAIVLLALFLWMQGFVRAFPRDPEPLELFSPLQRARALAALLVRAKRWPALAVSLRRGVFDRVCSRVRLRRSPVPADAARSKSAVEAIPRDEIQRLADVLGLGARGLDMQDLFATRVVRNAEDLALLDLDLRAFEREVEASRAVRATESSRPLRALGALGTP